MKKTAPCFFPGLSFYRILFCAALLFLAATRANAQSRDSMPLLKNELSLSLNTPVIILTGGGVNSVDEALYYTHRIDQHWAWRIGLGFRANWGPWLSSFDSNGRAFYSHFNKKYFSGKIGVVRYTRGKIFKAYYGIDAGYRYDWNQLTGDYVQFDTISRRGRTRPDRTDYSLDWGSGISLGAVLGLRADVSRHFALSAEFGPDAVFHWYQYHRYTVDYTTNYTPIYSNERSGAYTWKEIETLAIVNRLNLVYKF